MTERWVQRELRFLRGYAVVMSLAAAVFLVAAVRASTSIVDFDTITVHRINVTDADGKTRLALFGKQWEPPIIIGGKTYAGRSGQQAAGLMFYNDLFLIALRAGPRRILMRLTKSSKRPAILGIQGYS